MRMSRELISWLRCCQPLLLHAPHRAQPRDHANPHGSHSFPLHQAPHSPRSAGEPGNSQAWVYEDFCGSRHVDSDKDWLQSLHPG